MCWRCQDKGKSTPLPSQIDLCRRHPRLFANKCAIVMLVVGNLRLEAGVGEVSRGPSVCEKQHLPET